MKARGNETEQTRNVLAIGVWENEGGAPGRDSLDEWYGRRIEADRSWELSAMSSAAFPLVQTVRP